MKPEFYSDVCTHSIYAIRTFDENNTPTVFIGKTTSPRISAVYSRHICGRSKATAAAFATGTSADFHLLEELECTGAQAYKHVLAWIHLFLRNKHKCLNNKTTTEQAIHPSSETEEIIQQLECDPLDLILAYTYLDNPTEANQKPPQLPDVAAPQKTFQMNVRMTKEDKHRFDHFCKRLHLNQREGFSLLLDKTDSTEHMEHLAALLTAHEKKEADLAEENQQLRAKLVSLTSTSPKEVQAKKQFYFLKAGVEEYLHRLLPEKGDALIAVSSYRRYRQNSAHSTEYEYPVEEGFTFLSPQALLWGSSPHRARFLIGTDEHGNQVKLRYFPKRHCVGSHFLNSPYAFNKSTWYVGYQRASDGAMDLIVLLPLPFLISSPSSSPHEPTITQPKPSLDNQIKNTKSHFL